MVAVFSWESGSFQLVWWQYSAGMVAVFCWYGGSIQLVWWQYSAGMVAVFSWYVGSIQLVWRTCLEIRVTSTPKNLLKEFNTKFYQQQHSIDIQISVQILFTVK